MKLGDAIYQCRVFSILYIEIYIMAGTIQDIGTLGLFTLWYIRSKNLANKYKSRSKC